MVIATEHAPVQEDDLQDQVADEAKGEFRSLPRRFEAWEGRRAVSWRRRTGFNVAGVGSPLRSAKGVSMRSETAPGSRRTAACPSNVADTPWFAQLAAQLANGLIARLDHRGGTCRHRPFELSPPRPALTSDGGLWSDGKCHFALSPRSSTRRRSRSRRRPMCTATCFDLPATTAVKYEQPRPATSTDQKDVVDAQQRCATRGLLQVRPLSGGHAGSPAREGGVGEVPFVRLRTATNSGRAATSATRAKATAAGMATEYRIPMRTLPRNQAIP